MAPVLNELGKHPETFRSLVCVTGQHRQILDQVLDLFEIRADFDLNVMTPGQDLFDVACNVLQGLKGVLNHAKPDIVLVHGDTTTTMAAGIAGCFSHTRIGHVEAGLRTGRKYAPFPEEICRRVTGAVADLHFAPTAAARDNLIAEGIDAGTIFVTGNTGIDALFSISDKIAGDAALRGRLEDRFAFLDPAKRLVLVTCHRRENVGEGVENLCLALNELAADAGVEMVYPVHPNPDVRATVRRFLGRGVRENVHVLEPLDYLAFVYLMNRCRLIITDSGGLQEEAVVLGKPLVVLRDVTERPEAVAAGGARLVGTDRREVVLAARHLLCRSETCGSGALFQHLYGDGKAAARIADVLRKEGRS